MSIVIEDCDVLVVGAGAAGLRAALEAARNGLRTAIACKSLLGKAATVTAAGPIAARSEQARALVRELENWGAIFDRDREGLAHRGGRTGLEVLRALQHRLARARIAVHMECAARRLVTDGGRLAGALAIRRRDGAFVGFRASAVILATGGGAAAWNRSTAPAEATADGIALALAAGAETADLERVEFDALGACVSTLGGIKADPETGATRVAGLFAAGEAVALATEGNGLAEALILGHRAGAHAAAYVRRPARRVAPTARFEDECRALSAYFRREGSENPYALRAELGKCMDGLVGASRDPHGLPRAAEILFGLKDRLARAKVAGPLAYNPAWHATLEMESLLAFCAAAIRGMLNTEYKWQAKNDNSGSGAAIPAAAASRAIAS